MKSDYILIGSVLWLAIGLGLIFGYTDGTVGFSAASPVSGASLKVSINTTGLPAMAGVPLTLRWSAAAHRRLYQRNRKDVTEWATTSLTSMSVTAFVNYRNLHV